MIVQVTNSFSKAEKGRSFAFSHIITSKKKYRQDLVKQRSFKIFFEDYLKEIFSRLDGLN